MLGYILNHLDCAVELARWHPYILEFNQMGRFIVIVIVSVIIPGTSITWRNIFLHLTTQICILNISSDVIIITLFYHVITTHHGGMSSVRGNNKCVAHQHRCFETPSQVGIGGSREEARHRNM